MDWFATIGSGTGILFIFNNGQISGSTYNAFYTGLLSELKETALPNISNSIARNQGIYENIATHKEFFYTMIKKFVRPDGGAGFDFDVRFFYNSTLGQGESLDLLVSESSVTSLINHVNTTELTTENQGGFLTEIL